MAFGDEKEEYNPMRAALDDSPLADAKYVEEEEKKEEDFFTFDA